MRHPVEGASRRRQFQYVKRQKPKHATGNAAVCATYRLTNGSSKKRKLLPVACGIFSVLQLRPYPQEPKGNAGVTGKLWEIEDIAALIDPRDAARLGGQA
jgi:hypothetical protein